MAIDYSSLHRTPPAREVAAWRERIRTEDERAGRHGPASDGPRLDAPAWVGIGATVAAFLCVISVITGVVMVVSDGDGFGLLLAAGLAAVAFGVLWAVFRWRVHRAARGWRGHYRLMAFANDNGFDAAPVADPADLPGRIFGRGLDGNRVRHDLVAWTQGGRTCHVATESWHSGNPADGGPPQDHGTCRYLAVLLSDEPLPRVVLRDGRLEADPGEDDLAATVFTPRVLDLLDGSDQPGAARDGGRGGSRAAPPWEAETAGGWFFAYQSGDPDPLDASTWRRTFALVDALPAARLSAARLSAPEGEQPEG
ncbi:hypothetical protein [Ornithinimicrobium cavernae]|uniref:hypothetical protein n=1 Tax=Ornithinimicrobium cavernae TaxID=2666047 RepID=UPI000D69F7A6|nr:hypothetical protein [Ornithinimicrobium cavernae]